MKSFENHPNYNCRITLEDGREYLVYANWIHNEELDNWQGWYCQAGSQRLHIDKNLQVYSGECKNDLLGSALEGFDLLDGTICRRSRCSGCTDDILTQKNSPKSAG